MSVINALFLLANFFKYEYNVYMRNIFVVLCIFLVLAMAGYFLAEKNFKGSPEDAINVESGYNAAPRGIVLDLSGQGLTNTPAYIFSRSDIEELNLSNNQLEGSLQAEVRQLQNLKVLNLSNNKFTGVPAEIGQLKNLEVLNLSNNLLTGLPNELGNLSKLKLLDLSGNNYSEMDLSIIKKSLPSSVVIKTK